MAHAHSVDPRDAWMLFVRQSDKGINSKRRSRTKARRLKVSSLRYPLHQPPLAPLYPTANATERITYEAWS